MNLIIKIDVHGTKALLTEMPKLPEGITEPIRLAVTFDESWADIAPKRAVLWREGDALLYLDLDADKTAAVPTAFAETEQPFYIRIAGGEDSSLSTNELCASFFNLHTTEAAEPQYRVFDSSQAIVKNGTYFCENALLTEAVTVDIPYNADTTKDTVTPEALHAGYTAHDASGNPIKGSYTNPYNADTTKDTVTPEALHAGYTAHDASGNPIEGTYTPSPAKSTSSTLSRVTNVFVSATLAPVTTIARE